MMRLRFESMSARRKTSRLHKMIGADHSSQRSSSEVDPKESDGLRELKDEMNSDDNNNNSGDGDDEVQQMSQG